MQDDQPPELCQNERGLAACYVEAPVPAHPLGAGWAEPPIALALLPSRPSGLQPSTTLFQLRMSLAPLRISKAPGRTARSTTGTTWSTAPAACR